ncbi:hypothetical protein [Vogesella mureinivorans]|uniref:hypothetical protein n=1 Tax=Vogesella mureinivorans TaxID=657276 RepID=UPI0011C7A2DF|nr:hypothetical protein [Vogesella mureinivorans]
MDSLNSKKMSKNKSLWGWLFYTILLFTFLQNYYDLQAIMDGGKLDLLNYEGPTFIKLLKDLIYITIFIVSLHYAWKANVAIFSPLSFLIVLLIISCFVSSLLSNGVLLSIIGLRWCFPFLIFLLARPFVESIDAESVAKILFLGVSFCFAAQIYQIFNMPPIYGEILGSIPARTPGIFLAPNSAAFFACSSCALVMSLSKRNKNIVMLTIILTCLISILAQSGTGIICSILLLIYHWMGRFSISFFVFAGFIFLVMLLNLDSLTMREDYVSASGGNRLDVFLKMLTLAFTSFDGFGLYTNAAMLNQSTAKLDFVLDSLWASWLGNFGIYALPILFLTIMFYYQAVCSKTWHGRQPVLLVFLLFSMTSIVFEAFPMNIYIVFGLWFAGGADKTQANARC